MKFIQITSAGVANTRNTQCDWVLHALTDDGRIFEMTNVSSWTEVPLPVPSTSGTAPAKESGTAEAGHSKDWSRECPKCAQYYCICNDRSARDGR